MKRRVLSVLLAFALLSASLLFAMADALEAGVDEFEGIELAEAGEEFDGELPDLDGGALDLDDALAGELSLDGLTGLELSGDILPDLTDGAALAEQAAGTDADAHGDLDGTIEAVTTSDGMDNDALFEAWLNQVLPGRASTRRRVMRAALSGRASLDGVNVNLYDALVPMIR